MAASMIGRARSSSTRERYRLSRLLVLAERLIVEIEEQPDVARRVLASREPDLARAAVLSRSLVYLAARGSSDNAATYGKYLFETRGHVAALAAPSLFTLYQATPDLSAAAVIGISQSGASPDVAAVVRSARRGGAPTVAITNVRRSPLARAARYVVGLDAGPERSVAATKTFTATCVALARIAGAPADDAPGAIEAALATRREAERLARQVRDPLAVVGRGYGYPIALEVALKIKELAGVWAEPHSAADFAHGPIALARRGACVLILGVRGPTIRSLRALARDLRRRGARVLALTDDEALADAAHDAVLVATAAEHVAALSLVVPGQFLARALTLRRGRDPDRPAGLTKVTRTR
jgi:glucosamine--fructose-6-phosphate aminotransferase (isomerizing)